MKKCPFCAEEIQDEAIKCRFCQSFLSTAGDEGSEGRRSARESAPRLEPATRPKKESERKSGERKVLYRGSPSWRAFLGQYCLVVVATLALPPLSVWIAAEAGGSLFARILAGVIPFLLGAGAFWVVSLYRRSKVFRVTTTNIETEYGFFTKKIDVLELWRCRDVRYRQSILDRILKIAHIEIFTADVTTPHLCILGLPASRQLFENIRDSIEIQRQSRNVVGFVQ